MLFLIIVVLVFAYVFITVENSLISDSNINIEIFGEFDSINDLVLLEHRGGESLELTTPVMFTIAGTYTDLLTVEDLLDTDSKSDGFWNIGEQLSYAGPGSTLTNKQVKATIVDTGSNSIVFFGKLQEGYVGPFVWKNHALFSFSNADDALLISGSANNINGDVHSNSNFELSGSDNDINGNISCNTTFLDGGGDNQYYSYQEQAPTITYPLNYNVLDYQPGGAEAVEAQNDGKYFYIDGDFIPQDDYSEIPEGLYYVTGKADLGKTGLTGNVTIVCKDEIIIGGNYNILKSYCNDLLLFSNSSRTPCIKISGQNNELFGIIYAPNGQLSFSGSDNTIIGGCYANTIILGGSNDTITPA